MTTVNSIGDNTVLTAGADLSGVDTVSTTSVVSHTSSVSAGGDTSTSTRSSSDRSDAPDGGGNSDGFMDFLGGVLNFSGGDFGKALLGMIPGGAWISMGLNALNATVKAAES
jgi:hypothetical protein